MSDDTSEAGHRVSGIEPLMLNRTSESELPWDLTVCYTFTKAPPSRKMREKDGAPCTENRSSR